VEQIADYFVHEFRRDLPQRGQVLSSRELPGVGLKVGIVVIGRNEGKRLARSLQVVHGVPYPSLYVDSGSSDDSVHIARSLGVEVVELDTNSPFSAARGRNEGFAAITRTHPEIEFVQFLDGDCILEPEWLEHAEQALEQDPGRAAVMGQLQELQPDASPYNRLCALEWKSAPGDLKDFGRFGGNSMIRADVFRELGGYNPSVIAGEDSEFGVRMSLAGYKITKIDYPMAMHDAEMSSFKQWWTRAIRSGHAIAQRAHLNGRSVARDCIKESRSIQFWGIGLPLLILVLIVPSNGWSLTLLLGYLVVAVRVFKYRRNHGDSIADACLYTKYLILGRFANAIGLIKFYANRLMERYEIIEYK